ncbi:MAG: DUF4258 domain-containing protein [Saprospiraceae bacterium]|nr:DUF4258 domain-containing protein [Saprospiraceae bacterium]MCB0627577.1 DUF4258 domain-containing protein [Saprospiraceae bacterium]
MTEIKISTHAREQMDERGISEDMVFDILERPQQTIPEDEEKVIYQSIKFFEEDERDYLVRVFVNIIKFPTLVITVYRTSKIEKYWRDED